MIPVKFTDAENIALLKALKLLTPVQLLTLLVFLTIRQMPDRAALIQRIVNA